MKKRILLTLILLLCVHYYIAQTINPPIGRIAIVADGNSPDPDDL